MKCDCPLPTSLGSIPALSCPEDIGQIQKILFFRKSGGALFTGINPETDILLIANWSPKLVAVDDTKVIASPFFENHMIPQAEAITEGGGDNTTLDGVTEILGSGNITVTGTLRSKENAQITAMKKLICEDLNVAYINEYGQIIAKQPGGAGNDIVGIPIASFFISDAGNDGKNTNDKANFQYDLIDGWREDLAFFTPTDFNAKIDLGPL